MRTILFFITALAVHLITTGPTEGSEQTAVAPVLAAGIMAAGSLISGIGKGRAARKARKKAEKQAAQAEAETKAALKFKEQNKYQIPEEAAKNVALAQAELEAERTRTLMEEQADAALAGQVSNIKRASTSSADALSAMTAANVNAAEQKQNAALTGEQVRQQNLQNLTRAREVMGDYRTIQYDQNVNLPFLQRLEFAQGKLAGAMQQQASLVPALVDSGGLLGDAIQGAGTIMASLPQGQGRNSAATPAPSLSVPNLSSQITGYSDALMNQLVNRRPKISPLN